jgi:hypothetical protein
MVVSADWNRSTALHEAAHALAAHEAGFDVRELWVDEIGGYCGYRRYVSVPPRIVEVERYVVVCLAGFIAEAIYSDQAHLIASQQSGIRDLLLDEDELGWVEAEADGEVSDELGAALALVGLDDEAIRLETLATAGQEAERLVRGNWHTLEAAATELLAAPPRVTSPRALGILGIRQT